MKKNLMSVVLASFLLMIQHIAYTVNKKYRMYCEQKAYPVKGAL